MTEEPIQTNWFYFTYKYVIWDKNQNKLKEWEKGVDRIADMEVLEKLEVSPSGRPFKHTLGGKELKTVEIDDEWEEYTVVFSVQHPLNDHNDEMYLDGNIASIDLLKM